MRSYGGLWESIVSPEALHAAWLRVRRGHGRSAEVRAFAERLEEELARLRADLLLGLYRPAPCRAFRIWDPKPRLIRCAPVRDRVLHHAFCGAVAPLLERSFIPNSYACRKGKGMHRACAEVRKTLSRKMRGALRIPYFCKLDVRHFFDSVDRGILWRLLAPHFREQKVRDLLKVLVFESIPNERDAMGLPIGNLTSQWFANTFLDGFDHWLQTRLEDASAYFRYMDDMVFLASSKAVCWRLHDEACAWLREKRRLEIKEEATVIAPVTEGVPFLGLRIWPQAWRLSRRRFLHTRHLADLRRMAWERGEISEESFVRSLVSLQGGVGWYGLKGILGGENPQERKTMRSRENGRNQVQTVCSVAGVGTTTRRTAVLQIGTTTTRRTRTTTTASALLASCRTSGQDPIPEKTRARSSSGQRCACSPRSGKPFGPTDRLGSFYEFE